VTTQPRPLWGRICAAAAALLVTLVALLGALGLVPAGASASTGAAHHAAQTATLAGQALLPTTPSVVTQPDPPTSHLTRAPATSAASALPADSGSGKRIVFSMSGQRVWLVGADGRVARTYLVSGSLTDNLHPGTYSVFSTSRWATGIDDSGVMQYFVRFTHGQNAAIGFHSVPTKDGHLEETRAELGTPQSAGCIRQWLPDAKALWDFAPVGTKVVVTA
jgi:hypothetical protein